MKLIINADDFGLSKSISDGIIDGIKCGCITSTSIMVNMEYADYAIQEAIKNNIDCIGLHINFSVGKPIIDNKNLADENGVFFNKNIQIDNPKLTYEDAYNEIKAQLNKVNEYSNDLIKIDHLDVHHHLGNNENIQKAIIDIANEYNIPIRNMFECDIPKPNILYKDFTIKNVSIETLETMLSEYQDKDMVLELMTHPGYVDDYTRSITSYIGRDNELQVLKYAKDNGTLDAVELINFKQI